MAGKGMAYVMDVRPRFAAVLTGEAIERRISPKKEVRVSPSTLQARTHSR